MTFRLRNTRSRPARVHRGRGLWQDRAACRPSPPSNSCWSCWSRAWCWRCSRAGCTCRRRRRSSSAGPLAFMPGVPAMTLDPPLALVLFLPPLLMPSAFFTARRDSATTSPASCCSRSAPSSSPRWRSALWCTGWCPALPWAACFALGAVVSPPDAVAAEAVLERLHLPRRADRAAGGREPAQRRGRPGAVPLRRRGRADRRVQPRRGGGRPSLVLSRSAACWWARPSASVARFILRRIRELDLAIMVTLLTPWAGYIGGERLGVSGVLATVTAGLMLGWRQHEDIRPRCGCGAGVLGRDGVRARGARLHPDRAVAARRAAAARRARMRRRSRCWSPR